MNLSEVATMVNPTRVTVAFDKTTADLLEKISKEAEVSQSEVMRRALKFYNENMALEDPAIKKKIHGYMDMLLGGEHIILDVDHWLMFLSLIATSPQKEKFWNEHKEVAREWILLQHSLHPSIQPVEVLPHIDRFQSHKDARCCRWTQHDGRTVFSNDAIHDGVAATPSRTTTPSGNWTSAAHGPVAATEGKRSS